MSVKYCKKCSSDHPVSDEFWYKSDRKSTAGNLYSTLTCRKHALAAASTRKPQMRDYRKTPKGKFQNSAHKAKSRGLEWSIPFEVYTELLKRPCEYCNKPYTSCYGSGLDRKDSSLGYTLDNVARCCGDCNRIKSYCLTYDEMKVAMAAVLDFRKKTCGD